jgi:hypothetical protein
LNGREPRPETLDWQTDGDLQLRCSRQQGGLMGSQHHQPSIEPAQSSFVTIYWWCESEHAFFFSPAICLGELFSDELGADIFQGSVLLSGAPFLQKALQNGVQTRGVEVDSPRGNSDYSDEY